MNKEELIKELNDFLEIEGFDKVDLDKKIDMILDVISPKKQIGYAVKESIGMIRLNFKEIGKKLILKLLQAHNQQLLEKIGGMKKARCIFCGGKYTKTYCMEKKAYIKALEDIKKLL